MHVPVSTTGVFAPRYVTARNRVVLHRARNNNRPTVILKINNDGLPSEYMGLPPCLQALHPGIPDETNATRSIIRSFHVMIISRGKEREGEEQERLRELRCHLLQGLAVLADCQLITLDLSPPSLFRGLRFEGTSDFRSDFSDIYLQLDS